MEQIIDFTIGFSENVAWPWPIAVYLFLAGISGGAFAAAALVRIFRKQTQITPLFQAASFIALVTILLGMICLVFDLTKPLDFWKILIFYNPTSVMSVGVMALLVFIPTMFLVTLVSFYEFEPVKRLVDGIPCGAALLSVLRKILPVLTWIGLVFALTVCAYTGFLISALVRFPLINTAVLPALFVASGLSAGIACNQLGAVLLGESHESHDVHVLHVAEWPVMVAEALCIFMIAFALMTGIESAQMAAKAFVDGFWATEFWVGVVGVGFVGTLQCRRHDVLALLHPLRRAIKRDWCLNLSFCLRPRKENSAAKWDSPCLGFLSSQRAGTCCEAVESIVGSAVMTDTAARDSENMTRALGLVTKFISTTVSWCSCAK